MPIQLFKNDLLTIDIGFRYIKVIQLRKKKSGELFIVNYGIGDTPKGCIKNGAIKDKGKVIAEIMRVINNHNLSAKEAKIVISGTNIITRIIMINSVDEDELKKKVWEDIQANLPINLSEHSVDYKILDTVTENNEEKLKVFVTAVPKKIINSYIEILKELDLKPAAVDIPSNSVAKFFKNDIVHSEVDSVVKKKKMSKVNTDTIAVIDMGSETTIVNILKHKTPEFNRVLLMGSSNIDDVIFNDLGLEKHEVSKSEMYKKMYGIALYRDLNNELEWKCSEAAKKVISEIVKNIKMCFDFYTTRCGGEQISRIYLVGGGSQLKRLDEYYEEVFNIPVFPINRVAIRGIEYNNELNTEKINYLVNALGIAM